ncbi:MAG TPA: recombinase family protein [Streptosporangiaceae bacterium]
MSQKTRDHEQTGIESSDLEAQRWAEANGHEVIAVVADFKTGRSGLESRPNLRPWVTDPEKLVMYDGLLALNVDRLTRGNREETAELERWAREHNKALMITGMDAKFPSEGTEGIFWDLMLRQAHQEWLNTSERYRRMHRYLRDQGRLVGRPPWGYDVVDAEGGHKTIEPNELGRKYIPEIFERCVSGESLRSLARWLNDECVPPPNAAMWNSTSLNKIIRSPTYTGTRREQDPQTKKFGRVILRCEALVDPVTFRMADKAIKNRPKRGPLNNEGKALLAGILFCAGCGGPMYRNHKPGSGRRSLYYCVGVYPARTSKCKFTVRCEELDATVDDYIAQLNLPILRQTVVPGRDYQDEIDEIEQKIVDLSLEDMDDDAADAQLHELRAERRRLRALEPEPDHVELLPWTRHTRSGGSV